MPVAVRSTADPVMLIIPFPDGESTGGPGASAVVDLLSLPQETSKATTSEWENRACLIPHSYYSNAARSTERFRHTEAVLAAVVDFTF